MQTLNSTQGQYWTRISGSVRQRHYQLCAALTAHRQHCVCSIWTLTNFSFHGYRMVAFQHFGCYWYWPLVHLGNILTAPSVSIMSAAWALNIYSSFSQTFKLFSFETFLTTYICSNISFRCHILFNHSLVQKRCYIIGRHCLNKFGAIITSSEVVEMERTQQQQLSVQYLSLFPIRLLVIIDQEPI